MLVHEFASPHKFAEVVKVAWNIRQRIKPDSILPSDPKTSSEALQELSKASAFWRYQLLQRATHLDQPNSISPGQATF